MNRLIRTLIFFLVMVGIATASGVAFAKVNVVGTTPDLAAIAKAVGGKHVKVSALSSPDQDPHYVDPRPDKVLLLNKADLLIAVGLGLETGWLPPLQKQARNAKINVGGGGYLDASTVVELQEIPKNVDRSKGDIHPGGNPHFTFDPREAARIAIAIRDKLQSVDSKHSLDYSANAKNFNAAVLAVAKKQKSRFRELPAKNRNVVSYHKSLVYLYNWLGLKELIAIEPKPGVPPTPKHISKVLGLMKKTQTRVVVQETFYPRKTSKTLAKLGKGKLVVIHGGTNFPDQSYVEHIQQIADEVYDALEK